MDSPFLASKIGSRDFIILSEVKQQRESKLSRTRCVAITPLKNFGEVQHIDARIKKSAIGRGYVKLTRRNGRLSF